MSAVPAAVLFDWDGIVIDSHEVHRKAWFALAKELDKPMTDELFKESFGMRNETILPGLFGWCEEGEIERIRQLGDRKETLYREILIAEGIEPLPGVLDLLAALEDAGVARSIGSSTPRANIDLSLQVLGLADRFDAVTAAEDVTRGKPAPDVFLTAADKVGAGPEACVVLEDAHVGIEAGRAGGMRTIAVTTTHPRDSFGDVPDRIVDSLEEVTLAMLADLFA